MLAVLFFNSCSYLSPIALLGSICIRMPAQGLYSSSYLLYVLHHQFIHPYWAFLLYGYAIIPLIFKTSSLVSMSIFCWLSNLSYFFNKILELLFLFPLLTIFFSNIPVRNFYPRTPMKTLIKVTNNLIVAKFNVQFLVLI